MSAAHKWVTFLHNHEHVWCSQSPWTLSVLINNWSGPLITFDTHLRNRNRCSFPGFRRKKQQQQKQTRQSLLFKTWSEPNKQINLSFYALSQSTSCLNVFCIWGQQQVCRNLHQSLIFFHVRAGLINTQLKSCWSRVSGSVHQCDAEVSVVIFSLLKSLWWREVTYRRRPRRTTTCVVFLMCETLLHHTCLGCERNESDFFSSSKTSLATFTGQVELDVNGWRLATTQTLWLQVWRKHFFYYLFVCLLCHKTHNIQFHCLFCFISSNLFVSFLGHGRLRLHTGDSIPWKDFYS